MKGQQQPCPDWCFQHCAYSSVASGFAVPDNIERVASAKVLFVLEGAGKEEEFWSRPLMGATGRLFFRTFVSPLGYSRADVLIDNTIRCHPPENQYPTGKMKVEAEKNCRRWDYLLDAWKPTIMGFTYHPADLFKNKARFTLVRAAVTRAFEWAAKGERPMLCMGRRSKDVFAPHLEGSLKPWQNSWFPVDWQPHADVAALYEAKNLLENAPNMER